MHTAIHVNDPAKASHAHTQTVIHYITPAYIYIPTMAGCFSLAVTTLPSPYLHWPKIDKFLENLFCKVASHR